MGRTYRNGNGRDRQIQSLVDAFGDFRQEMGQHVGALKTGQESISKSFDEFKDKLEKKVDDHDISINQAKGSIGTWKWIIGAIGLGGAFDAIAHATQWLKSAGK